MSGRIYDLSNRATCKKCGSDMLLSSERNFWGPKCKNKGCDGGTLEAEYLDNVYFENYFVKIGKKNEQLDK